MSKETKKRLYQDKEDKLSWFNRRLDEMRQERGQHEYYWDLADAQYEADVVEDENNKLLANSKMEQNLVEFELGRTDDSLVYDVEPGGYEVDTQRLVASKHVLTNFLDTENFYTEWRKFRHDKAIY